MDVEARSLFEDVRSFYPNRAPLLMTAAAPHFQQSARFAPLPATVPTFRRNDTHADVPLSVQVSSELSSLSTEDLYKQQQQQHTDANGPSASTSTPPVSRTTAMMDTVSATNAVATARNNVALLRLPFPMTNGVLGLSNTDALWQRMIHMDNAFAQRMDTRTESASERMEKEIEAFVAAEFDMVNMVHKHFASPGAVKGYRHLPTTTADYEALMRRHSHSLLNDHRQTLEYDNMRPETLENECKMPIPSLFGYRHNNIIPLLEFFAYPQMRIGSKKSEDFAVELFYRITTIVCLQYFAFANARFFERDPTQVEDYAPSNPPFLLLMFNCRDWWRRSALRAALTEKITLPASNGDKNEQRVSWNLVPRWRNCQVHEENLEEMAKQLPFIVFYYKVMQHAIPALPIINDSARTKLATGLAHYVVCTIHQNALGFMQTIRFLAADVGKSMTESAENALKNSTVDVVNPRQPVYAWTKCYISQRYNTTIFQPNVEDRSLVCRALPVFFYHHTFSPYAPVIEESVEDYEAMRWCKQFFAPQDERGAVSGRYFPLYEPPVKTKSVDQVQDVVCAYSVHTELQNRFCARIACFLTKDNIKTLSPIFNAEWARIRALCVATRIQAKLRTRLSFLYTSHDVLLPAFEHEWTGSFPKATTTAHFIPADKTDYSVILEMRKATTLYEYRHCFYCLDEFCACIPTAQFQRLASTCDTKAHPMEATDRIIAYDESRRFGWLDHQQGISPVFSLTASVFFWMIEKRRRASRPGVAEMRSGRLTVSSENHKLVYTSDASDRASLDELFPPSYHWVSGCVSRSPMLCVAVQMHQRDEVDTELALEKAQAVVVLLKQLHAEAGGDRQAMPLDTATAEHVFRFYTFLSYFLPYEEDILYYLAVAFEALSTDAANNLYKPRYNQGLKSFCLPPKLAKLHRLLLRGCYLEHRRVNKETRANPHSMSVLPPSYFPKGVLPDSFQSRTREMFTLTLNKMQKAWDGCSHPADVLLPSAATDIASIVSAAEVHKNVFPHILVFHVTNHRARVNIAYALRAAIAGEYSPTMEEAFPQSDLWNLVKNPAHQFRFIVGTPVPGVVMTWNKAAEAITLQHAPDEKTKELLRIYMFEQNTRVKRAWTRGFNSLWVSIDDLVRVFQALIHRRVLYPLARLMWHAFPVDHFRYQRTARRDASAVSDESSVSAITTLLTWRQVVQEGVSTHHIEQKIDEIFSRLREQASVLIASAIPQSVRESHSRRIINRKRALESDARSTQDESDSDEGDEGADGDGEGANLESTGAKLNILYNLVQGRDRKNLQMFFARGDKRVKHAELPTLLFPSRVVYRAVSTDITTAIFTKGVIVPADVNIAILKIGSTSREGSRDSLSRLVTKVIKPRIVDDAALAKKVYLFVLPAMKKLIEEDVTRANIQIECGLDTYVDFYNALRGLKETWANDPELELAR